MAERVGVFRISRNDFKRTLPFSCELIWTCRKWDQHEGANGEFLRIVVLTSGYVFLLSELIE